ncbi:acyltransferase [Neobacillus drentensis]|uniref:acyltransferase n=1 Tax=Neobacillus drentensis TaxID=220684 RepID=UPI002FFE96A2
MIEKIKRFIKVKLLKRDIRTQVERLKDSGMIIGNNVHILNSTIDEGHAFLIEIGNDVTITNSTILAHDASIKKDLGYSIVGNVKIGSRVFIGWGSIVLCGVTIGDDVVIGAGSVVTKDIPSNSVAVGYPAKVIAKKEEFIKRHQRDLNIKPKYEVYYPYKTEVEKRQMKEEIVDIGYDL